MLASVPSWLLVAGFGAAGLFNAIGTTRTRQDFARWGFPAWWCRVTGGLELLVAVLVTLPRTREAGLVLGAAIIAMAALTVIRHRDLSHLKPIGAFVVLLALTQLPS